MIPINEYPVFEADQVLTADNLNNLFDYLDEQNRLTRTCLIGIGIVCGLDSNYDTGTITITSGLGVTSLGYLINFSGGTYSYARTYKLPDSVTGDEKTFYADPATQKQIEMWQLFTPGTDNPLMTDDEILTDTIFLQDKVVILLLELDIDNLKNCTTDDCDDKGSVAELNVRPILVNAKDLSQFAYTGFESNKVALPDLILRRYNVPFKELKSPTNVLNAFYAITNATALSNIDDAYNKCYDTYKAVLNPESTPPFQNLITTLNNQLTDVKTNHYIFTEYYYDYIDDLIKAYNEFREKGDALLVACSPDPNLFPYHLALCEALGDSRSTASAYRNYFIHSPVFGDQKILSGELQQLFTRMKLLIANFKIPQANSFNETGFSKLPEIKVTPSEYGRYYLSERAVPYYYDVKALLNSWNYDKTRKGKATKNLSYYADSYSSDDTVKNPLLYELEPYNFFRIEGHIGTNINYALARIIASKQDFSLPFDVIALNVAANRNVANRDLSKCYFSDLESLFNVLTAELLCKLHEPVCFLAKLPYIDLSKYVSGGVFTTNEASKAAAANASATGTPGASSTASSDSTTSFGFSSINDLQSTLKSVTVRAKTLQFAGNYSFLSRSFIDEMKYVHPYVKGTFIRHFCGDVASANAKYKTVGEFYLESVKAGGSFYKPTNIGTSGTPNVYTLLNYLYAHAFYFIDCVEELMSTLLPYYLYNINYGVFEYRYQLLVDEAKDFAEAILLLLAYTQSQNQEPETRLQDFVEEVVIDLILDEMEMITHLCIDEQIKTLLDEYQKRLRLVSIEKLFANYTQSHGGLDHKAGVTRGGTFILVYEEKAFISPGNFLENRRVALEIPRPQEIETANKIGVNAAADKSSNATAVSNDAECAQKFIDLNKYKLTNDEYTLISGLLGKIGTTEGKPVDTFSVNENIVFADFFLPYLCCSDCAPISYILQSPPDDTTGFSIQQRFLFDDAHNYPFTVSPVPASTNEITNPDSLNLLLEDGTLKLHPAMDISQTLNTTLTYKNIAAPITIVVPDASFTTTIKRIATGGLTIQVAAKNNDTDATYEWLVNDKENVFTNVANPPAVLLSDMGDANDSNSFIIQLTITYKINDNTSSDTKQTTLTPDVIKKNTDGNPIPNDK